jgi:hypothetical protein
MALLESYIACVLLQEDKTFHPQDSDIYLEAHMFVYRAVSMHNLTRVYVYKRI